jgi:hypothetical protein
MNWAWVNHILYTLNDPFDQHYEACFHEVLYFSNKIIVTTQEVTKLTSQKNCQKRKKRVTRKQLNIYKKYHSSIAFVFMFIFFYMILNYFNVFILKIIF